MTDAVSGYIDSVKRAKVVAMKKEGGSPALAVLADYRLLGLSRETNPNPNPNGC